VLHSAESNLEPRLAVCAPYEDSALGRVEALAGVAAQQIADILDRVEASGFIDQLRDMLNAGRPRTALGLLEGLWGGLPEGAEGRIRFRIKANIAACLLRLGRAQGRRDLSGGLPARSNRSESRVAQGL